MLFLEVAFQAVRGLPELVRLDLKKGVNFLASADEAARKSFLDAVFHTLHPDAGNAEVLRPLVAGTPSRASITLLGKDNKTYRLIRDLSSGGSRVLKQGDGEKMDQVSADPFEAAQFLRVQLQLPGDTAYERLFVFSPDSMASRGSEARSRRGGALFPSGALAPSAPGLPASAIGFARPLSPAFAFDDHASPMGPLAGSNVLAAASPLVPQQPAFNPSNALVRAESSGDLPRADDRRAELESKRNEYDRLRRLSHAMLKARDAHKQIEALSKRREQLRPNVEERRAIEAQIRDLGAAVNAHADLEFLPDGLADRIRNMHVAEERFAAEQKRVAEERAEAQRAQEESKPPPLWQDRYFQVGVAAAIVALVAGLALQSRGVTLLNVLGVFVAAAAALHFVERLEKSSRLDVRLNAIGDREAKLLKQYELDTAVVKKLLVQLETDDPNELLERLEEAARLRAELKAAEAQLAAIDHNPARRGEHLEMSKLDKQIEQLEAHLLSLEGSDLNSGDIGKRMESLGRELRAAGMSLPGDSTANAAARPSEPPLVLEEAAEDDDDERGYSRGYGGGGSKGGSRPGGSSAAGYFASSGLGGGVLGGAPPGAYGGGGGGHSSVDPTKYLLDAASDLIHQPVDAIAAVIAPRLSQYLTALTGGYYTGAHMGPRGELRVLGPGSSGGEVALSMVPSERALSVDAAIRFTLIEQVSRKVVAPVLIDDPFKSFDATQRGVFAKMLKYLGQVTQVLVLTAAEDLGEGHRARW